MVKITDEQRKELESLIPNAQELLEKDTDEDLLMAIDDLIIAELDVNQNELSVQGIRLQKLYDEIFFLNE